MHAFFERGARREDGIGEVDVRQREMGDGRLPQPHGLPFRLRQEIGMGHHRAPAEKTEAVEHGGVGGGEAGEDIAMLPVAFRAMGLHMTAAFGGQLTEPFERRIGAAGNEPRGDHRQDAGLAIVRMRAHIIDQRPRARDRRLRRGIAVNVRAVFGMVHRHLADQCPLSPLQTGIDQNAGRVLVQRGEIERSRRAASQQIRDERAVAPAGEGEVGIAGFEREGVGLTSDLERHVQRQPELGILRGMNMQIDKARQQIRALRQGLQRPVRRARRANVVVDGIARPVDGLDRAVRADRDQRILQHVDRAALRRVEAGGEQRAVAQMPSGAFSHVRVRGLCGLRAGYAATAVVP